MNWLALDSFLRPGRYHTLACLFILAFFLLRLVDLGENPKGFFCDEASIAFNARSILETGRDEHGVSFPVFFEAFGEYKPALYIYTAALSLAAISDVEVATRLPATVFLTLFLVCLYLLLASAVHPACGLLGVVVAGTAPWWNHFSHIAFNLSAVPFLLVLGLLLFRRGCGGSRWHFVASSLPFVLAMYTYPPARLFVPLFVVGLLLVHANDLRRGGLRRRDIVLFVALCCVLQLPLLHYMVRVDGFLSRVEYLNLFKTPFLDRAVGYRWLSSLLPAEFFGAFEGRFPGLLRLGVFLVDYVAYYNPDYLFFHADHNRRYGNPEFGVFLAVGMVGLLLGLVLALYRRSSFDRTLLLWTALYGLPGALTWEGIPNSGRGIVGFPVFTMLIAVGFASIPSWLRRLSTRTRSPVWIGAALLLLVYVLQAHSYYAFYYRLHSVRSGAWMQYGFRRMMDDVAERHGEYEKTVIVSTFLHYQPYVFALLYSGMSPEEWLENETLPWNLEIRTRRLSEDEYRENVFYVMAPTPRNLPRGMHLLEKVPWEDRRGEAFSYYEYRRPVSAEVPGVAVGAASRATGEPAFEPRKFFAHRGLLSFAPENTLLAMALARERGFENLEIDVLMASGGEAVVFHDLTLEDFHDPRRVCDVSADALGSYRPSTRFLRDVLRLPPHLVPPVAALPDPWIEELVETRIPRLREVFNRFGDTFTYHLDLKQLGCGGDWRRMLRGLVKLIQDHDLQERVFIESKDERVLREIKKLDPEIKVIFWDEEILGRSPRRLAELRAFGFESVDFHFGRLGQGDPDALEGFNLHTYTVNRIRDIGRIYDEVDYIITDLDLFGEEPRGAFEFFNSRTKIIKLGEASRPRDLEGWRRPGFRLLERGGTQLLVDAAHYADVARVRPDAP